jgi:hypothetical protein
LGNENTKGGLCRGVGGGGEYPAVSGSGVCPTWRAAQAAFSPAGYGEYFSWYNVNFTLNYPQEVDPAGYRRPKNA